MDPDIFAVLVPRHNNHNATRAISRRENRHYFIQGSSHALKVSKRGSTPEIDDNEQPDVVDEFSLHDRLVLRFSDIELLHDASKGWQFGFSTVKSDVAICPPGTSSVSRVHFSLSVMPDYRILLRQVTKQPTRLYLCEKLNGHRTLTHLEQDQGVIVLMAPKNIQYWDCIEIELSKRDHGLAYEIHFPNHTKNRPKHYVDNMRRFVSRAKQTVPRLDGLGLDSIAPTAIQSRQSHTPRGTGTGPLIYDRHIGSGGFGQVELLVDLTTGYAVARKRLFDLSLARRQASDKGKWDHAMEDFIKETNIMRDNPHRHIMKVLGFVHDSVPAILMPYYPLGSMHDHQLDRPQYTKAFFQLLTALEYLHSRNVAHRDLKPANIMVASLEPISIVVSDFGQARVLPQDEELLLDSLCQTQFYRAPEVIGYGQEPIVGKWQPVDIWSAGIIMLKWTFGLSFEQYYATIFWVQCVLSHLAKLTAEDDGSDPLLEILGKMVVLSPDERQTASECLKLGRCHGLLLPKRPGAISRAQATKPGVANRKKPTQPLYDDLAKIHNIMLAHNSIEQSGTTVVKKRKQEDAGQEAGAKKRRVTSAS